jgi:hypothetical protein
LIGALHIDRDLGDCITVEIFSVQMQKNPGDLTSGNIWVELSALRVVCDRETVLLQFVPSEVTLLLSK